MYTSEVSNESTVRLTVIFFRNTFIRNIAFIAVPESQYGIVKHNNKQTYAWQNEMKCSLSNAYTQRTVTSGVTTWLNGTGFTQFYLPPTRLSTNGMSHPVFIS